ncbi:N-6 DNA methylase [Variovorax sp. J22R24]|uniref:Eco57I restriction-modification methylase domain-containing protein n=1 Tax=Variovorax gracilis TaxID=3053502 RepID=UPI0025785689|nr:DNA methyltransferase [Variovorax sp. J22R24]MDM0108672.1 N-6 DNA methylase [Variovorax sp. J22R24]
MSTHSINNQPLAKLLRSQLEAAVKSARDVAEKGAHAALSQLAIGEASAPSYLTDNFRPLRRRLRAHGRALGDKKASDDAQGLQHLIWEVAYEHWHRMLFARFLAENGLLLWEPGAAVSLDDCEALVQETDLAMNLGAKSKWEFAGKLAARMLPQVFKPQSPVFELAFAPEHQRELERLLAGLPPEVFKASDSLGWVYQFWQAKRKDEVNALQVKIGADELPAVTQLFTEPYMVDFLLHNSLGAWWVTRHPGKNCPVPLTYLRTLEDGTPAAGKFEGWPDRLEEFTLLDPCCGSGHFLVAAFLLLVPMRMAVEGMSAMDAVDAVLADNLHGLELDARCVEIAVFALALAAWRFPDENGDPLGVRADMPAPQVACSGLKVAAKPEDWMALVPDDAANAAYLRQDLRLLHASFAQAPLLGSLLDPARSLKSDLATSNFETLRELLGRALAAERPMTVWEQASEMQDDSWDLTLTAQGLLDAAHILDGRYHLVVTNVPYLTRSKQHQAMREYSDNHYFDEKSDLATTFLERCLELCKEGGNASVVLPQNWLFLSSYKRFRAKSLKRDAWKVVARLGYGAFNTPLNAAPVLVSIDSGLYSAASTEAPLSLLDVAMVDSASEKRDALRTAQIKRVSQRSQLANPDSVVSFGEVQRGLPLLSEVAIAYQGLRTGDINRFIQSFWERDGFSDGWEPFQTTIDDEKQLFSGLTGMIRWESGRGSLHAYAEATRDRLHDMHESGNRAWSRIGVAVEQMGELCATVSLGYKFDNSLAVIFPRQDESLLPAIAAYLRSEEFSGNVREIDQSIKVTNATLTKVPFDVGHWKAVAALEFPQGLPKPQSHDFSQAIFHGHPEPSTDPLQVAVARLAGYRWPAETDTAIVLADEARAWIARCDQLAEYADDDGIVCLPSVRGEAPAHDRLLNLLIAAWETVQPGSWKPAVLAKLLADADCAGKGLDVWLRDKFFEQHAKRFHHRPFVWHVWDGLKDGFGALVNYHQFNHKKLERLIHTYLGDWIRQQEVGVRESIDGAQTRLTYAQDLKRRLELILEGESPYDIFVRWKPLAEQPIGWTPDLNDGVRLNIRPFMTAEVLRHNKKPKLNITWDKDRGKDVESAPWFKTFGGDRMNDHHLTVAEKQAAREADRATPAALLN